MKKYYYKLYDLIVKSDFKMDELLQIEERKDYDVCIKYENINEDIKRKVDEVFWYHIEDNYAVLEIRDVANYYIKAGKEIIVDPFENYKMHELKTFILGSCFGILLKQRGQIAIHGGAVKINNKAFILTGKTGAGKSTLTNAFMDKGYKFLSDDVSPLNVKEIIKVMPAYPQQKLCKDAMDKMGYNTEEFKKIDEKRDKYAISAYDSFIKEPLELGGICEIELHNKKDVNIEEVKGKDKILSIIRNIYRIEIFDENQLNKDYFKKCLNIALNIPLFKIKRPKDGFTVNRQIELINEAINNYKEAY